MSEPPARSHQRGPRKLHVQIYLAIVLAVGVAALASMLLSRVLFDRDHLPPFVRPVSELLVRDLPHGPALRPALERRARELRLSLALWDESGRLLAEGGPRTRMRPPRRGREVSWVGGRGRAGFVTRLPDGRYLGASLPYVHFRDGVPWPLLLALSFVLLALATYPVARRITRRLERLSSSVQRFGAGELSARVVVEGKDEVAGLAASWNEAASRIEQLVSQQRRVLASASHELRAPLSRLRMAYELLLEPGDAPADPARAKLLAQVSADIEELDALVGDVLLAARAQDPAAGAAFEQVELSEVLRAECERARLVPAIDAAASNASVRGDRRMLARLIRNLIDNAHKHAAGAAVEVTLARSGARLALRVLDRGPGVPEAERERIFEPFYRPAGHRETRDGGVGLGLSLVADIARIHGGSARCLGREGGGTVLEVELPAS